MRLVAAVINTARRICWACLESENSKALDCCSTQLHQPSRDYYLQRCQPGRSTQQVTVSATPISSAEIRIRYLDQMPRQYAQPIVVR
jgi:hypothetical protein